MALNPLLAKVAAEHDGFVLRAHLAAQHLSPNLLRAALKSAELHRVGPGVFIEAQRWRAAQRPERYLLTVRGLLLAHPDWIASHHAALAVHGLPLHDVNLDVVDVVAPVKASKVRTGVHVHVATPAQLQSATAHTAHTVRAVSVAEACVLTAAQSTFRAGVVAMDAALHRSLATESALRQALELPGARFGITSARAALTAADGKCESPGETLTRLILKEAALEFRSQVWIEDAEGAIGRVDFLVGERVVVEFDGAVKYDGIDGKRALVEEKKREDRLRAAGFRVVRLTWADLSHPERVVRLVRGQLAA